MRQQIHDLSTTLLGHACHQDPSICWHVFGLEVLCPRCIGVVVAFFLALFLARSTWRVSARVLWLLILTGLGEWALVRAGLFESTSFSRLITGALSGVGIALAAHAYYGAKSLLTCKRPIAIASLIVAAYTIATLDAAPLLSTVYLVNAGSILFLLARRARSLFHSDSTTYETASV
jgi:uncharacterized membrane protein